MRDLVPPEAASRAALTGRLLGSFARWGYELVTTTPFEQADVIERGLDTVDRRDRLRFVDPSTGEVALLRPDLTPQVARIAATQLAGLPLPFRLCTSGSLIRMRRGRARRDRQIFQAGVELVGLEAPNGDVEVISLAAEAIEACGLEDFQIELSSVRLTRTLLSSVPDVARGDVAVALHNKDTAELARALGRAGAGSAVSAQLDAAARLFGGPELLKNARRAFGKHPALDALSTLLKRLTAVGLGPRLTIDFGSIDVGDLRGRSFDSDYYTGESFAFLADGPGEPIGRGGRYDELLSRFGAACPATGFGIDIANLEWALRARKHKTIAERGSPRFLVLGGSIGKRAAILQALRQGGAQAAEITVRDRPTVLDYARAWRYDAVVFVARNRTTVHRVSDGKSRAYRRPIRALTDWSVS